MPDNEIDLAVSEINYNGVRMPALSLIELVARRMQQNWRPPKGKTSADEDVWMVWDDFKLAAEICFSEGMNPLSRQTFWWKFNYQVMVMEHYVALTRWAQNKDPFTYVVEFIHSGDSKNRNSYWEAKCTLIKRRDQKFYNDIYLGTLAALTATDIDPERAVEIAMAAADKKATSSETARVNYNEVYTQDGRLQFNRTPGPWNPGEHRAATRALRAVIRKAYGEPNAAERMMMQQSAMQQAAQYLELDPADAEAGGEYLNAMQQHTEEYKALPEGGGDLYPDILIATARQSRQKREPLLRDRDWNKQDPLEELPFSDPPEGFAPPPNPLKEQTEPAPNHLDQLVDDLYNQFISALLLLGMSQAAIDRNISELFDGLAAHELTSNQRSIMVGYAERFKKLYTSRDAEGKITRIPDRINSVKELQGKEIKTLEEAVAELKKQTKQLIKLGETW